MILYHVGFAALHMIRLFQPPAVSEVVSATPELELVCVCVCVNGCVSDSSVNSQCPVDYTAAGLTVSHTPIF